jgi:hypothetical protein
MGTGSVGFAPTRHSQSLAVRTLVAVGGELLVAPLWWYTGGLLRVSRWWLAEVRGGARRLSLRVLVSHWLTPMYGQYDVAGRIISFFARTVLTATRLVAMVVWLVIVSCLWVAYAALPPLALWQLTANLGSYDYA